MSQGSPMWQGALLLFAILFLAFEVWRGWRAGFARAGINFAAIIISTVVGLFAAHLAAVPFGGYGDAGGFFAALVVGGGLGCFVFLLLWLSGIIFFKRTDHQGSGLVRLLWGAGGAFFGLLIGIAILWGGITVIRSMGALAEARVDTVKNTPTKPGSSPPPAGALANNLLKLKDSLELGPAGKFVESVDVMPPDFYEIILQIGKLTSDQQAMLRFIEYPGVKEVMQSPRMAALANDPDLLKAAEGHNIPAMLANKNLLAAAQDPALAELLKKIDLRAAMKFALEKPTPSPAPSHVTTKKSAAPAKD